MVSNPFHVLSDGKTVRRISEKQYLKSLYKKNSKVIGWVDKSTLLLHRNGESILISRKNIEKILELTIADRELKTEEKK